MLPCAANLTRLWLNWLPNRGRKSLAVASERRRAITYQPGLGPLRTWLRWGRLIFGITALRRIGTAITFLPMTMALAPSWSLPAAVPGPCTFCNKTLFRNKFRERSVDAVLQEVDTLIARGVEYIYFIDEIFGVGKNVRRLLEGIAGRPVKIGFQTRIDLWNEETLGPAGPCPLHLHGVRRGIHHA